MNSREGHSTFVQRGVLATHFAQISWRSLDVKFQDKGNLYDRLFSGIMMSLAEDLELEDEKAIAVLLRRSAEPDAGS